MAKAGSVMEAQPAGTQFRKKGRPAPAAQARGPALRPGSGQGTSVESAPQEASVVEGYAMPADGTGRRLPPALFTFLGLVVLPFLLALWYYTSAASDQFVAEARFAVRSVGADNSSRQASSGGGGLLSMNSLTQDAYVVASFIHSPEILVRIGKQIDLPGYFNKGEIDWWARLPADATREDLFSYWKKHVTTYIDGPSGIITLGVRTFSPETARHLAALIASESEILVNELSERARADVLSRAQLEVERTAESYRSALASLNAYQNESGILDPATRAGETGVLLTTLMAQKLEVDAKLFVMRQSLDSESPAVRQLARAQATLEDQIGQLRSQLANISTANANLSSSLKRFSELETDRMLAEGLYEAARRNLASVQAEVIRKAAYLTVFVEPTMPEDSRYPRRIATPLLILLGLLMSWGTLTLAIASVDDHRL